MIHCRMGRMFVEAAPSLKELSLFAGLTEAEKSLVLKNGIVRHYAHHEPLFTQGDPIAHFYIITQGAVQLYRTTADGHEKTVHILKSGQPMCETEIMDNCRSHRMNAKAVNDTTVVEFPLRWLRDTAKNYSPFALNLLSLISQQTHLAEIEAEHQAVMSAAQLVACFLQRLCVLYGFDPKHFTLPYPKTLIASRLGMELETFSRTLAKLKEHGIRVEGNVVKIEDLKRIEHYVCSMCSIADDCATHRSMGAAMEKPANKF